MYMELENFQDIIDFPNYMINENGEIYSKFNTINGFIFYKLIISF